MTIHRIWHISVGKMPQHKAYAYLQKIKNEAEREKSRKDKKKYVDYYFAEYGFNKSRLEIIETNE